MEKLFERKEILRSFQKFNDYSSDLLTSNSSTFDTRLAIFIDFCEKDKVMGFITTQLKGYDFAKWKQEFDQSGGSMAGSADFKLPVDEDERLSLLYQMLLKTNSEEFNFLTFCTMAFCLGNRTISGYIYEFNEAITRPLVRDLGYKLEEIGDNIGEVKGSQQITQDHLIIINNGNITNSQLAIGANIKQIKVSRDADLDALVNKLADLIITDKSLMDTNKDDLLSDVESMKLEMQKNRPIKGRIMGYLENFVTVASLAEMSQQIIGYISTSGIFN